MLPPAPQPHGMPTPSQERRTRARPPEPVRTSVDPSHSETIDRPGGLVATRDHRLIRAWAALHHAEPATGEATGSGPATLDVNDHGAGIRFNFPGAARFRPVDWAEWLGLFDRAELVFVCEPHAEGAGSWYEQRGGAFYRLVPLREWTWRPLAAVDDTNL